MRRCNGWHVLAALVVIGLLAASAAGQEFQEYYPITSTTAATASAPTVDQRINDLEAQLAELQAYLDEDDFFMPCGRLYSGAIGEIEYLYLRARRTGLIAAGDFTPGALRNVDYDYDANSGLRAGFGYRFETGWDIIFTYTYFHTSGRVGPTAITHPLLGAATASGNAGLDYDVFDLDVGRWRCINPNTDFRLFAGVRYGIIDQAVNSTVASTQATVTSRLTNYVDAIGLRAGGQLHWNVLGNFTVFGRGATGVLVADASNAFAQGDAVAYTDSPLAPSATLEAALGGSWRRNGFEVSIGYELTQWFNVSAMAPHSTDAPAYLIDNELTDLMIDGFFGKISWNY